VKQLQKEQDCLNLDTHQQNA
ncbi:MAG TPA: anti-anti-sigma factor, partial [Acinetobacter junii]|nr:anti-anti-sigma factor [Acinetobacter junii]